MEASRRRFTILDGMILLAALALGLALVRIVVPTRLGTLEQAKGMPTAVRQRIMLYGVLDGIDCVIEAWAVALIVLRRPRRLRRVLRQPGIVACVATVISFAWGLSLFLPSLIRQAIRPAGPWPIPAGRLLRLAMVTRTGTIAAAWALLILGRSWRPEPDWIDRTGRAIGLYWLTKPIFSQLVSLIFF